MNNIEIKYQDGRYSVILDGEEIAKKLMSIDVAHMSGLEAPQVSLGLRPGYLIVAGQSNIGIDRDTHDLLMRLGWTPPGQKEVHGE